MNRISFDLTKLSPLLTHSSKGNQPKWKYRNKWYKIDSFGYESLAEVLISRLLESRYNALTYSPIEIEYNGSIRMGSVSNNFLKEGDELYTLEQLHIIFRGTSLAATLDTIKSTEERIQYTVDFIKASTGLENAGATLTEWLELDAIFLNEDRHTNNIAFIRDAELNWRWAPYFDNGLSLLSDIKDYPIDVSYSIHKRNAKAKPFSTKHSRQVAVAEKLYGKQLSFSWTQSQVDAALSDLTDYYDAAYIERVKRLINV